MEIWNYDSSTGELLSQGIAASNPLEPGAFLIPAFATTIAPPAQVAGKAIVFAGGAWSLVTDDRGQTWYEADGTSVTVKTIGDPAASGLLQVAPAPAAPTKAQLTAYAEAKQQSIAQGGFTVNANTSGAALNVSVSTTPAFANYLSSAVQLAQLMSAGTIPSASINWVQNSGNVALTPAQVITVGVAVAALVQQSFTVLGQVLAAINAGTITTTAQIDAPPAPIPAWPANS